MSGTVIVGAGVAGVQTALELRQHGYTGDVTLVSAEKEEPYDRPPLSKEYLKKSAERTTLSLLSTRIAEERSIDLRLGQSVSKIHSAQHRVELDGAAQLPYDHLVLATGAHNRPLSVPGADASGVCSLRRLDEADRLRGELERAEDVVVVGGGFIGLEVAAAARARGANVTVVEFLPRVMARALSPEMASYFADQHTTRGVCVLTGVGVEAILAGPDGSAQAVALSDGSQVRADVVVVGVGVLPATDLAAAAGLTTDDGVVVDDQLRTSDPSIYAIGDCARFECRVSMRGLRLESIQNAVDQARFVAARIAKLNDDTGALGQPDASYAALPWFWTEQYDSKLQIAGSAPTDAESVVRGDPSTGSFSVCRFVGDLLVAVESVNQARDHLGARKLLAADPARRRRATRDAVGDPAVLLKTLLDL